ncbi:MAG: hypothetical protein JRJ29_14845 [Deltaproteobacteria bacterium]|nr:hypothetical protein [Deltaproteobacteria bacterium]
MKNLLAKNLRCLSVAGVAALGLITILATGDGGGGTSTSVATLSWNQAGGMSGTAALTASSSDGVYHFDGALESDYMDIFWPVGARKAVYIISDSSVGNGTITEVGEAYLTF